ncbi:hypothetical protein [Arthrobacter methylotrophus]|uniref:hypothetical protein n=1 Tax=Arthrobacter methylotrophus TaxID=121291 RepID=UPI0031EC8347
MQPVRPNKAATGMAIDKSFNCPPEFDDLFEPILCAACILTLHCAASHWTAAMSPGALQVIIS